MRNKVFYSAVYWIIENKDWKILFAKRWDWANWYNWRFQIPAWHIDWNEKVSEALIREMKEELDINVIKYELVHTTYRKLEDSREYIDFYFKVLEYTWEIKIWEPDKCSELIYKKIDNISNLKILKHDELALKNIKNNIIFSEIFLKDDEY